MTDRSGGRTLATMTGDGGRRVTRRQVLEGALAAGAVALVGGMAVTGRGRATVAQPSATSVALAGALTMLRLESDYWQRGLDAAILSGRDLEIATEIAAHAVEQRALVEGALADLGERAPATGGYAFPPEVLASRDAFLGLGADLEALWAGGLQGLLPAIDDPGVFAAAAAIAGVKSRHAAVVAALAGRDPLPAPIEQPLTLAATLDRIAAYRDVGGG